MITIKEAIRNDFLKHLFFEFSNNIFTDDGLSLINEDKEIIFEERGIFPYTDEILDRIYKVFKPLIKEIKDFETKHFTYKFDDLENLFIHSLIVDIDYTNLPNQESGSNGHFVGDKKIYQNNKLNEVWIIYKINCKKTSFEYEIKSLLAHELMHAYEDYNRRIKGKEGIVDALEKDGYFLNKDWKKGGFEPICLAIRQIKYFLAQAEQNAYLIQIREELKKYADKMYSAQDAYRILSEKTMFKAYITIGENINYFINFKDKEKQEIALNEWNRISKNKVEKYYNLKRILKNKYLRRLQTLERKLSIIAEEVFTEYGPKRLVNFTTPKKI